MTKKQTTARRKRRGPSPEAQAKRTALCHLSKDAKIILNNLGTFPPDHPYQDCQKVNDVLRYWHRQETGQHNPDAWDTFQGWKARGFSVCKGEKGFLIWGQPRKMKGTAEQKTSNGSIEEVEKEYSAFPLCYLFHAAQVQDAHGNSCDADCPLQKLILIPAKIRRAPLRLPGPAAEQEQPAQKGGLHALA